MIEERSELLSGKLSAGSRTYFFDVRESANGTKYLVISESRQVSGESYEHSRVMVFEEHVPLFYEEVKKAVRFITVKDAAWARKLAEIRREYANAYMKWTKDEDQRLIDAYSRGKATSELAGLFQRQPSAILSRLEKLGLEKK